MPQKNDQKLKFSEKGSSTVVFEWCFSLILRGQPKNVLEIYGDVDIYKSLFVKNNHLNDPAIPVLGVYPKETRTYVHTTASS